MKYFGLLSFLITTVLYNVFRGEGVAGEPIWYAIGNKASIRSLPRSSLDLFSPRTALLKSAPSPLQQICQDAGIRKNPFMQLLCSITNYLLEGVLYKSNDWDEWDSNTSTTEVEDSTTETTTSDM